MLRVEPQDARLADEGCDARRMRRLQGQSVNDQVTGPVIVYDNKTSVFQVEGSSDGAASSGRVRGVITPRSSEPRAATEGGR